MSRLYLKPQNGFRYVNGQSDECYVIGIGSQITVCAWLIVEDRAVPFSPCDHTVLGRMENIPYNSSFPDCLEEENRSQRILVLSSYPSGRPQARSSAWKFSLDWNSYSWGDKTANRVFVLRAANPNSILGTTYAHQE